MSSIRWDVYSQYEGGLSVQFLLSRDATTLITTRSYKQSLLVFVSACVGGITGECSIVLMLRFIMNVWPPGLMAVFGLVMRLIELLLENLWCKKAKTIRTFASHTSGHAVPVK